MQEANGISPTTSDSNLTTPRSLFWLRAGYMVFLITMGEVIVLVASLLIYLWEYSIHPEGRDVAFGYGLLSLIFWGIGNVFNLLFSASIAQGASIDTLAQKQKLLLKIRIGLLLYLPITWANLKQFYYRSDLLSWLQQALVGGGSGT